MRKLLLFLTPLILLGCQQDPEQKTASIHGQLTNPLVDYIALSRNEIPIDTIPLADNNTFSYEIKNVKEGLYTINHSHETQTIYVVPEDSIVFRLNTLAFDETIYYSGTAADKNNLLTELFLLNEKNNDLIFSYFRIDPKDFASITDSIISKRKQMFGQLRKTHTFSEKFVTLVNKSIQYEFYDLRERYAFLVNKYLVPRIEIPSGFFNYRKQVNFNDQTLQSLYVYQRFLDNYLKNKSIENCGDRGKNRDCYNLNNYYNLKRRILLTDSLFTLDVLKDRFYRLYGRKQIIFANSIAQIDSTLSLLNRLGYDGKGYDVLKDLAKIQGSFFIGSNIAQKKLIATTGNRLTLGKILTRPTILFIWTMDFTKDHRAKHKKIKELREKYPEINFVGINIDIHETKLWQKTLKNYGYASDFEYQIYSVNNRKQLYKNYLNKTLFINTAGEIVFGSLSLDSNKFENYIVEFLNL